MVDGTFTQQTGSTIDRLTHNGMGAPKRRCGAPIGRPEDRDDRYLERGRNVHGTGVIREEQGTPFHRRHEFPNRRRPGQDQGAGRQTRSNLLAQTLFPLGSEYDHTDLLSWRFADRAAEPFRSFGEPFWQPAFGPAIGRTGVDSDDDICGGQSALRKSPRHRLLLLRKDDEFRRRGIAREAQRLQQVPIIADLMNERAVIRHSDWIGQQQASTVCRIPIAPRYAGQECQESRLERILKQDCQIEPLSPQLPGQRPLTRKSRMTSLGVVGQHARQRRMAHEQIGHSWLNQ